MNRLMVVLLGVCLVWAGAGCSKAPKMQPLNLKIAPDPALKERGSLRVHLVGVQDGDEVARLKAKDVGAWFSESDADRRGFQERIKELTFTSNQFGEQTLPASDPIWQTWKGNGALHLVVLSNMAMRGQRFDAQNDPRKRVIPLDAKFWEKTEVKVD